MKKTAFALVIALLILLPVALAETLALPESATGIEAEAFMGDTSITEVTLPEGIETIGERAFLGCDGLAEIKLPASIVWIGEEAFPAQTVLRCVTGSYAHSYAVDSGYEYVLEEPDPYDEFEGRTPSDFQTGTVLSFGSGGFAVLREEVRTVSGTGSGSAYTVQSAEEICPDDVLYLPNENALIRVASVTDNGDGSYAVQADGGAGIGDFYQYINYSATLDGVAAEESNGAVANKKLFAKKYQYGSISVDVNTTVSVNVRIRYDRDLFGEDYFETRAVVAAGGDFTVTATAQVTKKWEIPLFTYSIPTQAPGVLVDLNMSLPIEFSAKAKGELSAGVTASMGFEYDSANGLRPVSEASAHWDASLEAEASLKLGPKATVGVSFMRLVSANVGAQAGVEIKTTAYVPAAHSGQQPKEKHACDLCFSVTAERFIELSADIRALGEVLDEVTWPVYSEVFFEGYLSMINEEASVHGGRVSLGEGECPNWEYLVTIEIRDPEAPDEIKYGELYRNTADGYSEMIAEGPAPLEMYLYPGSYTVASEHLGNTETMDFQVTDSPLYLLMDFTLIPIDEAHFPDGVFREWVADTWDTSGDGYLSSGERGQMTSMSVLDWSEVEGPDVFHTYAAPGVQCQSLRGIEYFTSLRSLYIVSTAPITELDLSQNQMLTDLYIHMPQLTGLDLTGNANLTNAKLINLPLLSSIDLTQCAALKNLVLCDVPISTVDLSGNPALASLSLGVYSEYGSYNTDEDGVLTYYSSWKFYDELERYNESLTNLDLSYNPNLKVVVLGCCHGITSLDLSNHQNLQVLYCPDCRLTEQSLNISGCTALKYLDVSNNPISHLDLTMFPDICMVMIYDHPEPFTLNVSHKRHYPPLGGNEIDVIGVRRYSTVIYKDRTEYIDGEGTEWVTEH